MARLKMTIRDDLMNTVLAYVRNLWRAEDSGSLGRFVRDALRRYLRYSKDGGA